MVLHSLQSFCSTIQYGPTLSESLSHMLGALGLAITSTLAGSGPIPFLETVWPKRILLSTARYNLSRLTAIPTCLQWCKQLPTA